MSAWALLKSERVLAWSVIGCRAGDICSARELPPSEIHGSARLIEGKFDDEARRSEAF
jgi:hypothetical protein